MTVDHITIEPVPLPVPISESFEHLFSGDAVRRERVRRRLRRNGRKESDNEHQPKLGRRRKGLDKP